MEEVNRTVEVEQGEEAVARKPWQTPIVEELLVSAAEAATGGGGDLGIYS